MNNHTLVILGSSRGDGNTRKIVDHLLESTQWKMIDLLDYNIGPFDYMHENRGDDFIPLIEDILQKDYQTLVFATPVYWYAMSGIMKDFFDRISDLLKIRKDLGRQLRGRSVGLIMCSSNDEQYPEFYMPFKRSADYLGMKYLTEVHTWIEQGQVPEHLKADLDTFAKAIDEDEGIPLKS